MSDFDDREAIEAELPDEHRRFVKDLFERYEVPTPDGPGMRSRFVRSDETAERQIDAVVSSDVDLFAYGIGMPPSAVERAKANGKTHWLWSVPPSMQRPPWQPVQTSWSPKATMREHTPASSARAAHSSLHAVENLTSCGKAEESGESHSQGLDDLCDVTLHYTRFRRG